MSDTKRKLGHISSETHWEVREENRAEIEDRRASDPWPWLEELHAWNERNSTAEVRALRRRWDPPPSHSHKGKS